jgi:hypothetical protein
VSGKKVLANRLASGFVFLLTNPEFYLHLVSLRVVIRTPALVLLSKVHSYYIGSVRICVCPSYTRTLASAHEIVIVVFMSEKFSSSVHYMCILQGHGFENIKYTKMQFWGWGGVGGMPSQVIVTFEQHAAYIQTTNILAKVKPEEFFHN